MKKAVRIVLIATVAVVLPSISRATFISEQNQQDGLLGAGAVISGNSNGEYVEFVNDSASPFGLNGVTFSDTNQPESGILSTTITTYDFAFKTSGSPSLAPGQALLVLSRGTVATSFSPRNQGGSLIAGKDSTFNDGGTVTLNNGSGVTTRNATFDTGATIGISTSTNDAIAAYLDRTATGTALPGPWLAVTTSSSYRLGDVAGGAATAHPTLGAFAASPGVKSNGTSWVTPDQSVAKISGAGLVSGFDNVWNVAFGTVNQNDVVNTVLALGNSAGLGGILQAIGAASATGDVTITSGAGQTLDLMGGETTNNYGALGTINGFNYSDGAAASNLAFALDTSTPGVKSGSYTFTVRDGFSLVNGATASPLLEGGTLTINFTGTVAAVPEPSTLVLLGLGLVGISVVSRHRR